MRRRHLFVKLVSATVRSSDWLPFLSIRRGRFGAPCCCDMGEDWLRLVFRP